MSPRPAWNMRIEGVVVRLSPVTVHLRESEADVCRAILYELAEQVPPCEVQMDLSNIVSVSSVVLGILLNFRRHLLARKATLTLVNVRPEIQEILDVTRLTAIFLPQEGQVA